MGKHQITLTGRLAYVDYAPSVYKVASHINKPSFQPPLPGRVITGWELGTGTGTGNWELETGTGNWELGTGNWNWEVNITWTGTGVC